MDEDSGAYVAGPGPVAVFAVAVVSVRYEPVRAELGETTVVWLLVGQGLRGARLTAVHLEGLGRVVLGCFFQPVDLPYNSLRPCA